MSEQRFRYGAVAADLVAMARALLIRSGAHDEAEALGRVLPDMARPNLVGAIEADPPIDCSDPSLSHADVMHLFQRVGRFHVSPVVDAPDETRLVCEVATDDRRPCVYLWVEETRADGPLILYVGKTGRGLRRRHGQHGRGFERSEPGRRHARSIRHVLERGGRVSVWVLFPNPVLIGGETVAIHSSLEDHLLARMDPKPPLNREGRRSPPGVGRDGLPGP